MPDTPIPTVALSDEVEAAFTALASYDRGSPRGALVPLDEAVKRSLDQPAEMARLEERFIRILRSDAPLSAKEYVCRQLMLLGSARCVPCLAPLLQVKDLADAARGVLETLPAKEAAAALRESLARLEGTLLAGAITSLGARRDAASVPLLTPLLRAADPAVVEATVVALGRIGDTEARKALHAWRPESAAAMEHLVHAALLECGAGDDRDR